MKRGFLLLMLCSGGSVFAKDFGTRGQTFPIAEESMISYLQRKMASFDLEGYKEELEASILNPPPLSHIGKTTTARSFLVDMTQTADGEGVNPLDHITLSMKGLLFFDGGDPEQVAWARKQGDGFLWVLVKGSPIELEKTEKREVYFDQMGFLTQRLQIQNAPAKATQKGNKMLIEEMRS